MFSVSKRTHRQGEVYCSSHRIASGSSLLTSRIQLTYCKAKKTCPLDEEMFPSCPTMQVLEHGLKEMTSSSPNDHEMTCLPVQSMAEMSFGGRCALPYFKRGVNLVPKTDLTRESLLMYFTL